MAWPGLRITAVGPIPNTPSVSAVMTGATVSGVGFTRTVGSVTGGFFTIIFGSGIATIVAVITAKLLQRMPVFRIKTEPAMRSTEQDNSKNRNTEEEK